MSEQTQPDLKTWIGTWPTVRHQVEQRLAEHAQQDPTLHFELTLAELELKDIDEAVRRIGALGKVLYGDDLSTAERQGTGN
jgi:hypothetical protein